MCIVGVVGCATPASGTGKAIPRSSDEELDRLQRAAFAYLWEQRDSRSGLVYNTTEPQAPASPTAAGAALTAIPIGIERGWVNREEGYQRAVMLLRSLHKIEHVHGFFYHFLDPASGRRTWQSEVSCIDSAILFAGAMVAAQYFAGTEVDRLANQLIDRAEWPWFLNGEDTLQWGWKPEAGFEGGPMQFSESILAYLLALGSPTHPIPGDSWQAMRRPISRYGDEAPRMVYTVDGSLFAYVLPLAWFDLRDRHDAFLDYWTNAKTAIQANIQFCRDHAPTFRTYQAGLWGLSAALGPDGYKAYGAPPGVVTHDGTVAPYVVAASIPWIPDVALGTLRRMEQQAPTLWTRYGLGDGLNLDRRFICPHTIALDQGLVLVMIENHRTGLVWDLFMRHPIAQRALTRAGFESGSLAEPSRPAVVPGNPGATMAIPMIDHAVTVDGDLSEWIRREAIELSPVQQRHLEQGVIRDAADASVLLYLGWSENTLYAAGIITDDELVTQARDAKIYEDDCLELFADLDGDGFRFDGNPRDVQIGLSPRGPDGRPQLWAWGAIKQRPQEVHAAVQQQENQWLFELSVPLSMLPGLSVEQPVRLSVAYHDRDSDGKEGKLHWSVDTASVPGTILFGQVTLEPPQR